MPESNVWWPYKVRRIRGEVPFIVEVVGGILIFAVLAAVLVVGAAAILVMVAP